MTIALRRVRGSVFAAAVLAIAAGLSGCGGFDGVELNGKLFDALGVSGDTSGKRSEPKTQARAPLVIPPDATRLPEPGSVQVPTSATADQAWPKDREAQRIADADAKKRAQEAHCRDGNWKQKAMKDDIGAAAGPNGSCNNSIFSVLGKSILGSDD